MKSDKSGKIDSKALEILKSVQSEKIDSKSEEILKSAESKLDAALQSVESRSDNVQPLVESKSPTVNQVTETLAQHAVESTQTFLETKVDATEKQVESLLASEKSTGSKPESPKTQIVPKSTEIKKLQSITTEKKTKPFVPYPKPSPVMAPFGMGNVNPTVPAHYMKTFNARAPATEVIYFDVDLSRYFGSSQSYSSL